MRMSINACTLVGKGMRVCLYHLEVCLHSHSWLSFLFWGGWVGGLMVFCTKGAAAAACLHSLSFSLFLFCCCLCQSPSSQISVLLTPHNQGALLRAHAPSLYCAPPSFVLLRERIATPPVFFQSLSLSLPIPFFPQRRPLFPSTIVASCLHLGPHTHTHTHTHTQTKQTKNTHT